MIEGKCAIWGTPATISDNGGPQEYNSVRTGGKYRLGSGYLNSLPNDVDFKVKLTSWIINQRFLGVSSPEFTTSSDFIEEIRSSNALSTSERIDGFLKYCELKKIRPGQNCFSFIASNNYDSGIGFKYADLDLLAWTESSDMSDFLGFSKFLKSANYIEADNSLTSDAFKRIEEFERANINSKQVFVAMWFDPLVSHIFEEAIAPAIREAGFDPIRIDRKEHNNKIDDEIIAELRQSRFVIADFTSATHEREGHTEAIARGGVYYEAGFAHGMGIPVIWTCRYDMIGLVHFDTRQYNHIDWRDTTDLKKRLYDRIRATIT